MQESKLVKELKWLLKVHEDVCHHIRDKRKREHQEQSFWLSLMDRQEELLFKLLVAHVTREGLGRD